MKTLKLEHELAVLVLAGKKNSTWRMFDDKDISVNDDVALIDKVDPANRASWKNIGTAHINEVVEKRLGDLTTDDMVGHEQFSSPAEMLATYQKYYGSSVTMATPLKIIRFSFTSIKDSFADIEEKNTTNVTEVKLFADGGSRGNPGPSASGFAILDMHDQILLTQGIYLGVTTNNQAEYQALKVGLQELSRMGTVRDVHVYMDSLLVINQMLGIFKVKNRDLWPIHDAIKELITHFRKVTFTQVPREYNKLADRAVNEALDAASEVQD